MSLNPARTSQQQTGPHPPKINVPPVSRPNHRMSSVEGNRHFLPLGKRDTHSAEIYRKFKLYDCGPGNPAAPELVPYSAGGKYPRAPPSAYLYATTVRAQGVPFSDDACKMLEAVLLWFEGWLTTPVYPPDPKVQKGTRWSWDAYANFQALAVVEKRKSKGDNDQPAFLCDLCVLCGEKNTPYTSPCSADLGLDRKSTRLNSSH